MVFKTGYMPWNKGKKMGNTPWNKGKTKETDIRLKQMSEEKRMFWRDANICAERNQKISHTMKEKFRKGELIQWNQGKTTENDVRLRSQAKKMKELWRTPEFRGKMLPYMKELHAKMLGHPSWHTKDGVEKTRKGLLRNWADPTSIYNDKQFLERRAKAILISREKPETLLKLQKSYHKRPTKFEKEFIDAFPKLKYTGDFSFWVGRKNPDFVVPQTNICIDLFGNYWHDSKEAEKRISYFAERGYSLIIVWERMWKNNSQEIKRQIQTISQTYGGTKKNV